MARLAVWCQLQWPIMGKNEYKPYKYLAKNNKERLSSENPKILVWMEKKKCRTQRSSDLKIGDRIVRDETEEC